MKKKKNKKLHSESIKENNLFSKIYPIILIIVLGVIIYSNTFNSSFHFDDQVDIVKNSAIRDIGNVKIWWNDVPRRSVGMFTFVLNYHFHNLQVFGYHIVNIIIHIINALLVFWLINITLCSPVMRDKNINKNRKILALLGGLIFISHPIQTQAVTYIVQRLASFATLFYILSLLFYAKARFCTKKDKLKYPLFFGSAISAILGMFTKEIVFTLPFVIILYEFCFITKEKIQIDFREKKFVLKILLSACFIFIIPITYLNRVGFSNLFQEQLPDQGHLYTLNVSNYLFTQFRVIVTYIRLLFLPINQNLDYDYPVYNSFFDFPVLASFLFLISLLFIAIYLFRKQPLISFGILYFFITLSVESSIIPIQNVIFEHRLYLPMFGFVVFFIALLYFIFWNRNQKIFLSISIFIIICNSTLTFTRNKVWENELTLWSDVVKKSPNKARPNNNLGFIYSEAGNYKKAKPLFEKALQTNPNYVKALNNRGGIFLIQKKYKKAIIDFSKSITQKPTTFFEAYHNRGLCYFKLNQYKKAKSDFDKAIKIDPYYSNAYFNRGNCFYVFKKLDSVIIDFTKAIKYNKNYYDAYFNRGLVYLEIKKYNKAISDFSNVLKIVPNFSDAYYNRGLVYFTIQNHDKAIFDFTKAIRIKSNYGEAFHNRAICYYHKNKYKNAFNDMNKAEQLGVKISNNFKKDILSALKQ